MPDLFCPLRRKWVADLPEEKIRQGLIQEMTLNLGYPKNAIVLEKSLNQIPHLQNRCDLPKRRADLLVFVKDLHPHHPYYPLLLIECKAVPLTQKVLRQLIGYNQFIGSYFIGAVNHSSIVFGWYNTHIQDFSFTEGLFPYEKLLRWAKEGISP